VSLHKPTQLQLNTVGKGKCNPDTNQTAEAGVMVQWLEILCVHASK